MNYRVLDGSEWERLLPLFEGREETLPAPEVAACIVAEDEEGEIQGMILLQVQFHLEPLIIRSPRVNFKRLYETLQNALADRKGLVYYALIRDPKVARIASLVGMQPETVEVWKGQVI